jgi:uncharacterized C2H2 Zn-finger protein
VDLLISAMPKLTKPRKHASHSSTHNVSPPRTLLSNSPADRGHVRTVHEKRKDHACPHCAAAFGTAGHLTTHVRTVHEKRKDHACPHCAAAFTAASSLTRHVRVVHEKRHGPDLRPRRA